MKNIFDKDNRFLTEKNGMGEYDLKVCIGCNPGENNAECGLCDHFQEALNRLGEYEASGLTPKEVSRLAKEQKK